MRGRAIHYSAKELAWLKTNCTLTISEYHRAFCAKFTRDVSATNLHALRKRNGWRTGRTGRFERGEEPHNKGQKMPFNERSAATRFKAGHLPHNFRGVGHEFVCPKDGYAYTIIHDERARTKTKTRRVLKHKHLWELANGPVPDGMALKCLDSNRLNTDPANWEAVPRAILPRLNGGRHKTRVAYDDAPDDLKPAILTVAKIAHRVRSLRDGGPA